MARKPRDQFAGGTFHVWARRVDRRLLFVDEDDYRRYVALLARTVERFDWILLTYCLMPNHVHLIIELREANLGRGMQWLQGQYVRHYNDRHGRPGRLFEHRYKSRAVRDELYFVTLVQYVDHNPVEAGLCSAPEEWPWSARGLVARGSCPSWLAIDSLNTRRDELKDAT